MSKKRRKKKNSKSAVIVAVIIILALIIGLGFLFSGNGRNGGNPKETTSPEISTTLGDNEKNEPEETEKPEDTTAPEETEEATKKEDTTIPTAAPVEKVEEDLSDMIKKITAHYESYMSMDKGVLFINESEAVQRNGKYEFILRSNAKSPNQYVADVYVDMKTGAVEDSMGSETWFVEIWY